MKPFFMYFFFRNHEKDEKSMPKKIFPVIKQKIEQARKIDFQFIKTEITEKMTAGVRLKNNLLAIKTLKRIEAEDRLATKEEQVILSKYAGWGGQSEIFDPDNKNYNALKEMLSDKEYVAARNTITDAFFTDPLIADEIYKTIRRFGFKKGNILEPSLGAGVFFSVMHPSNDIKRYGVEIDSVTGRIAKQLYQTADMSICGLEKSRFEDNFFDVCIGNIPFGDYKIPDRKYDKYHFLIHDYFIAKVIDLVRPGGVIALITSKGTMDKKNSKVRKYFAKRVDLIGAIRLPNSAFRACAGTDVTSDILFFQKKKQPLESPVLWTDTTELYNGIYVNRYFAENPDMILGEMKYDNRFGDKKFTYCENKDFSINELHDALNKLSAKIEICTTDDATVNDIIPADPDVRNFTYCIKDGKIYFKKNSIMAPIEMSMKDRAKMTAFNKIRHVLRELIELQAESDSDEEVMEKQKQLNHVYDSFVAEFGYISKNRLFRDDADYPLLCALEVIDTENNTISKADIFTKRTVKKSQVIKHCESAADALNICMNQRGYVDISYISYLCSLPNETINDTKKRVIKELQGLIYLNPEKYDPDNPDNAWEIASEYLSGNVRAKLEIAKIYAQNDPVFKSNVERLKSVLPEWIEAADIEVQIGTPWIESTDYEKFMYELFDTPPLHQRENSSFSYYRRNPVQIEKNPMTLSYFISNKSMVKHSIKASESFGTKRIDAYSIYEQSLNLKTVTVKDRIDEPDGSYHYVVNKNATLLAREKQQLIQEKFKEWIFSDANRRKKYVTFYNETYNNVRLREYDGSFLTFPGINHEIELKPYQKNAVARILFGGNTLLAHSVGAGKSFEMIAACMELRRLGYANKPMIVVPKPLIQQMASEFIRLYPSANILVATEFDFTKNKRKEFVSRIATMDFDCVIMSHNQFEKIPLSPERIKGMLQEEISNINAAIESSIGENWTTKQLIAHRKKVLAKVNSMNDLIKKDDNIYFEELGVDCIMIDEAHGYKNCAIYSKINNVSGINSSGAKKSSDMMMKCRYLNEIDGRIVFATGTPISNTMCEMYIMQRYLQEDELKEKGLQFFDAWAAMFGEVTTSLELTVEGNGYRFKSRFNRFKNLPELMTLFKEVADIKLKDSLNLDIPELRDNKYIIVESHPDNFMKNVMEEIVQRAEAIHNGNVDPSVDNFLKITNDARLLGTDARLLDPDAPDNPDGKLNKVVENIVFEYRRAESLGIIGTQLVFSDIGTPNKTKSFTVYGFIKEKLVQNGIPEKEIAFIHDAGNDEARKRLFQQVRKGAVKVLIGSTDKCGTGVNVQDHLVALHHVDCPWKPSCIEQREGRALRQGNLNKEVAVYRYVTKGTFDAYSWSIVENKQRFISQIMTSKVISRSCEDVDEAVLSYAEIKAVATGNPLIKEKMQLDNDVARLKLLKASFNNQKYRLEDKIREEYPESIRRLSQFLNNLKEDIAIKNANESEEFCMEILGRNYTERTMAGGILIGLMKGRNHDNPIGKYCGFDISILTTVFGDYRIQLSCSDNRYYIDASDNAVGNVVKIENLLKKLEEKIPVYENKITEVRKNLSDAEKELKKQFDREEELQTKSARLAELNIKLNLDHDDIIDPAA